MSAIHPLKLGLTLAAITMLVHAMWALVVAVGWGQPLVDVLFILHFIRPVYTIAPFDIVTALGLVAISGLGSFCVGFLFAEVWDRFHIS